MLVGWYGGSMETPTFYMSADLLSEIDSRRDVNTSRSEWVRGAIRARAEAEDDGTWEGRDDDPSPMEQSAGD